MADIIVELGFLKREDRPGRRDAVAEGEVRDKKWRTMEENYAKMMNNGSYTGFLGEETMKNTFGIDDD